MRKMHEHTGMAGVIDVARETAMCILGRFYLWLDEFLAREAATLAEFTQPKSEMSMRVDE